MFHKFKNEKVSYDEMSYGIVGLGRFGFALAVEMAQSGCDIMVIDSDEEKVRDIREYTENAFVVSNLEKKTLMDTGIQDCDVAIVCIGEHIDTSILTTLNLVSMNIPKVIAKATSAEHGMILEKLGAEVVYPERDMAVRLANRLETSRILDLVQLSEKINVTKIEVPMRMLERTVMDVNLRARFGLNIIAIENNGEVMEVVDPRYMFRKGDILYLSGCKDGMHRFGKWMED